MARNSLTPDYELPVSVDLLAIVLLTVVVNIIVVLSIGRETLIGSALGFLFLLFAPGYALIAVLFPRVATFAASDTGQGIGRSRLKYREGSSPLGQARQKRLGFIERVVLSAGASAAIIPLVAFILNETTGIQAVPLVITLSIFTLSGTLIAAVRRRYISSNGLRSLPTETWIQNLSDTLSNDTGTDVVLNTLLALSIIIAAGGVAIAALDNQGSGDTELALLVEDETGELVADDYPTTLQQGESERVTVYINNSEGRSQEYTTVIELQQIDRNNENVTVTQSRTLRTATVKVADGNEFTRSYEITPEITGDRLRFVVLLYRGSPPENPTVSNAYRDVHLWMNVSADSTT